MEGVTENKNPVRNRLKSNAPLKGTWKGIFKIFWSFLVIHLLALKWIFIELFTSHREFKIDYDVVKKCEGKWAVVTGGTRGIGAEVVRKLYQTRMNIVIGCRNRQQGRKLVAWLKKRQRNYQSHIVVALLDLTSFNSVKCFAIKTLYTTSWNISLLVNNAGIMFPKFEYSDDMIDKQLQTNFLGHFCLVQYLMPGLTRAGTLSQYSSRVVNVSSIAHYGATISQELFNQKNKYQVYMDSKFYQIATAVQWNKLLEKTGANVHMFNVHPGIVDTRLYENVFYYKLVAPLMSLICKTPAQGADTVVYAALSPKLENEFPILIANCKGIDPHPGIHDTEVRELIWSISCILTETCENESAYLRSPAGLPRSSPQLRH